MKFKGVTTIDRFDSELTIGSISGIKKIADFRSTRMDTSPQKRVELHCHTKMSDMDGVTTAKDLVKRGLRMGAQGNRNYRPWCCTGFPGGKPLF